MQKTSRKPLPSGRDFHQKCHTSNIPQPIKPRPHSSQSRKCDTCSSEVEKNRQKCKPREPVAKTKKNNYKIVCDPEEFVSDKPSAECFIDKNYINNPIILETRLKKCAPIKELDFDVPKDEKCKSVHYESMDWRDYHQLSVIHKFMDDLEADFPSLCTTGVIGTSIEGRALKKISSLFFYPRYFLPVVNPDGYHYSHTTDRMWRKNRAWHGGQCVGVDLNRNFSIGWGTRGSSDKPTSAFYRGPEPFSEPESSAIRDLFMNSGINFEVYITLHSYGQIIIFPYACSKDLAPDYVRLLQGATAMSKAIYDTNGNTYKVGISRDVMYGAGGTSNDFAHGAAGIPYCYLIELRSKKHKFKLPKEQIQDTGNEIYNCVQALMEFVDSYSFKNHKEEKSLIDSESLVKHSFSDIYPSNSHEIKRESYDRRTYSFAQESNSFVQSDNSFIRWPNVSPIKDNPLRLNDDFTKVDDDNLDKDLINENEVTTQTIVLKDENDSFEDLRLIGFSIDTSDSFLRLNNSFIRKGDDFCDTHDVYLHNTDSYKQLQNTESCGQKHDNLLENTDSNSYEDDIFLKGSTDDFDVDYFFLADSPTPPSNSIQPAINKIESLNKLSVSTKETNVQVYSDDSDNIFLNDDDSFWEKDNSQVWKNSTDQQQYISGEHNLVSSAFRRYPVKVAHSVPNTQVWEVNITREGQRNFVKTLDTAGAINIWKEEHNTMDILIDGPRAAQVAGILHERDISYSIAIPDVAALLEREQGNALTKKVFKKSCAVQGSSDDPGNVFYRGPKAFSEPETAAVKILEANTTFKVFISFHSYGEVIIFPWGYTSEPCPDYVDLLEGGTAMAKAIFNKSGRTYKVGSTKDLMYYAAGTSVDWSYAVANIPYSYMVELRGKTHKFLLPKEEIISTATEIFNGIERLMEFVDKRCTGTQSKIEN
ncbi:hypothetical protein HF086_012433 [Spodoptera exigua]|uniref:Peptidase M14 domain-containing protein n=1 Tax=Spodoptera exigua TaxID=7107 RepID=A0A922M5F3_SPOEX|nr:hypothetical protein HF086_012433 [Spodoptera exigua]